MVVPGVSLTQKTKLTRPKVSVRATSLDLGDFLLLQAEHAVDTSRIRANGQTGHSEAADRGGGSAKARRNTGPESERTHREEYHRE